MTDNTQAEALAALIERFRGLHIDHEPDGWPAVRTREITALLGRIAELEAQLSSSGFTAADMATAAAQGFRDGVASVAASAPAPSAHIKEPYTLAEIKAKIASNDYGAEMLLQHAMLLLDSASLSANAGEPVAWKHDCAALWFCQANHAASLLPR